MCNRSPQKSYLVTGGDKFETVTAAQLFVRVMTASVFSNVQFLITLAMTANRTTILFRPITHKEVHGCRIELELMISIRNIHTLDFEEQNKEISYSSIVEHSSNNCCRFVDLDASSNANIANCHLVVQYYREWNGLHLGVH